jgi:acetyl esterase/lipase
MPQHEEPGKQRVVYSIPTMEQVTVKKNITYKTVDGLDRQMDVYYPPDFQEGARRPAVIFSHGDPPPERVGYTKDTGQYFSWGQLTAACGLIAITLNHRASERLTKAYEVATDIDDLLSFVLTHAETLGVNKDAIGIWVCSAGTPFGLRAAMREGSAYVRCIISYYGPMNLQHLRAAYPPEIPAETFRDFSALYHLSSGPGEIAPIFIARAGLDYPELNESIDQFVSEALAHNISLSLMNHSVGHHGFDIRDDTTRSREIIKATLEFMKAHLEGA